MKERREKTHRHAVREERRDSEGRQKKVQNGTHQQQAHPSLNAENRREEKRREERKGVNQGHSMEPC